MKRSTAPRITTASGGLLLLLCISGALCFTVQRTSLRQCGAQMHGRHTAYTALFVGTNLDDNNSSNEVDTASEEEFKMMMSDVGVKIAAAALFGFIFINVISFAASLTTAAASALFNELGHELMNLISIVGNILLGVVSGIFGLVKMAAPAIGQGAVAAGKAAAPVIESTVKTIGEAAAPIVQDVTDQISQTAAPYVQPVIETVDTSVKSAVGSISNSVDANVMSPMRDAATSVSDSFNTAVDSSIREAARAVDDSILSPMYAARESVTSAVDSKIKGATESALGVVDSAMKGAADAIAAE